MEHIVRTIFKCWIRMRNCCRKRPKSTEYKRSWTILYENGSLECRRHPLMTEDTVAIFETVTRIKPTGQTDLKTAIHHNGKVSQFVEQEELFVSVPPPWLMITCDGEDYTDALHDYICPGNTITDKILKMLFKKGKWVIMDPKTFEDVDFPSEGIVIN